MRLTAAATALSVSGDVAKAAMSATGDLTVSISSTGRVAAPPRDGVAATSNKTSCCVDPTPCLTPSSVEIACSVAPLIPNSTVLADALALAAEVAGTLTGNMTGLMVSVVNAATLRRSGFALSF